MWSEIVWGILFPMLVCSALMEEGDMKFIEFFTKPVEKDQRPSISKNIVDKHKAIHIKVPWMTFAFAQNRWCTIKWKSLIFK